MPKQTKESLIKQIAAQVSENGGTIYYVGGYVRDKLLGKQNKDIDVEIHNISVEDTREILSSYGPVDTVGAAFGVLMVKGYDIDFTFPRTESKVGAKHTDFDVTVNPFLSTTEAARRRDFTMNAIMEDVLTGEIVDPFGGLDAINNRTIQYVDPSTFVEDPLRSLRAAQFASRLGFTVDKSVIELANTMDYTHLSPERIKVEFDKALLSDKPSTAMNYLLEMGVLEQVMPELANLSGSPQSPTAHAEGDVWNHTMLVMDHAATLKNKTENPLYFMYASMLHDIGKPATLEIGDTISNKGHEKVGADMIPAVLGHMTNETKLIQYVTHLTENHMKMHNFTKLKPRQARKMLFEGNMNDLYQLLIADESGRISDLHRDQSFDDVYNMIEEYSNDGFGKLKRDVQGRDLIALGATPGPEFAQHLENALSYQLSGMKKDDVLQRLQKKLNPPLIGKKELNDLGVPQSKIRGDVHAAVYDEQMSGLTDKEQLLEKAEQIYNELMSQHKNQQL